MKQELSFIFIRIDQLEDFKKNGFVIFSQNFILEDLVSANIEQPDIRCSIVSVYL